MNIVEDFYGSNVTISMAIGVFSHTPVILVTVTGRGTRLVTVQVTPVCNALAMAHGVTEYLSYSRYKQFYCYLLVRSSVVDLSPLQQKQPQNHEKIQFVGVTIQSEASEFQATSFKLLIKSDRNHSCGNKPVSYTHLQLPKNREV